MLPWFTNQPRLLKAICQIPLASSINLLRDAHIHLSCCKILGSDQQSDKVASFIALGSQFKVLFFYHRIYLEIPTLSILY